MGPIVLRCIFKGPSPWTLIWVGLGIISIFTVTMRSISVHSVAKAYLVCVGMFAPLVSALTLPATLNSPTPTVHDITTLRPRANITTTSNTSTTSDHFLIRLMPLGASITNGYLSTDHNGYRDWIRQQLRYEGWDVEMVGSLRNGTMVDNVSSSQFKPHPPHSCI